MAEKTYKSISDLVEGAKTACEQHIRHCKLAGLDVFITETYRSQARQDELYAQGRSAPGNIVTWSRWSNHTGRKAWDICFKSTLYNELGKFYDAGKIADKLGIEWGGIWKNADLPHFQFLGGSYMLPTSFSEAQKLADQAQQAGIIGNADLWYSYMVGILPINKNNIIALLSKALGFAGSNADYVAAGLQQGIITDGTYWLDVLKGSRELPPGNLRALLQKLIAARTGGK